MIPNGKIAAAFKTGAFRAFAAAAWSDALKSNMRV